MAGTRKQSKAKNDMTRFTGFKTALICPKCGLRVGYTPATFRGLPGHWQDHVCEKLASPK